jgi:16S rRNA (guanine966-N2)-methyltransferase
VRIISGREKGRKLFTPPLHNKSIRPTSDRAREALFNILGKAVEGAKVLDLFAGTGAMGLEAFSRNAGLVVFVDNSPLALHLIKRNINHCLHNYTGNCQLRVINHDLSQNLPLRSFPREAEWGYNLIFADPPYGKDISLSVLSTIDRNSILARSGTLIIEERATTTLPDKLPHLCLIDKRTYGECGFWLYQPIELHDVVSRQEQISTPLTEKNCKP